MSGSLHTVPKPGVLLQAVEDGAVLFDTTTEEYFGLNGSGASLWSLYGGKVRALGELVAGMSEKYPGVDADELRGDVAAWVELLLEAGLLTRAPAAEDA